MLPSECKEKNVLFNSCKELPRSIFSFVRASLPVTSASSARSVKPKY